MLLLIPKPLRRDSSFNTDEVFYKKLNEEDLDYKKHVLKKLLIQDTILLGTKIITCLLNLQDI